MHNLRLITAAAVLALWPVPGRSGDLSKIDRTIRKEPVYQSKAPTYCLLVFGVEAKTRVWLVRDGDVLYVDRNGNGYLTEEGERVRSKGGQAAVFEAGDITEADGQTKHTDLRVQFHDTWTILHILVKGQRPQMASLGAQSLRFAARPQDAPILHFNGPLTIRLAQVAKVGAGTVYLAEIGTPGLGGDGAFAAIDVEHPGVIPKGISMFAELEYAGKKQDGKPIKAKFALKPWGH
jgi:hypothetical protein